MLHEISVDGPVTGDVEHFCRQIDTVNLYIAVGLQVLTRQPGATGHVQYDAGIIRHHFHKNVTRIDMGDVAHVVHQV